MRDERERPGERPRSWVAAHRRILRSLDRIERGLRSTSGPPVYGSFGRLLRRRVLPHIAEEESQVFPLWRQGAAGNRSEEELLEVLRAEHGRLRELFGSYLSARGARNERHLRALVAEISDLLRAHIRREETLSAALAGKTPR
ncbi:MAG: hypothetical protein KatS3mg076_0389 [Candidatus Binatia bacterium]|nr:MAG: hypothetical protein KatS3mg076_0389 [Candidatus Binatia bacterium]